MHASLTPAHVYCIFAWFQFCVFEYLSMGGLDITGYIPLTQNLYLCTQYLYLCTTAFVCVYTTQYLYLCTQYLYLCTIVGYGRVGYNWLYPSHTAFVYNSICICAKQNLYLCTTAFECLYTVFVFVYTVFVFVYNSWAWQGWI